MMAHEIREEIVAGRERGANIARWMAGTVVVALALTLGCDQGKPEMTSAGHAPGAPVSHDAAHGEEGDHGHDDHDHAGHNHAEMGKHGGHVIVLDPGHIHAEWVHLDSEETLQVFILDAVGEVRMVQVVSAVKDQEPSTVELTRDETLGDAAYMVKNPNLLTSIQMADGESIRVTLEIETGDGKISADLSDDHDHDH